MKPLERFRPFIPQSQLARLGLLGFIIFAVLAILRFVAGAIFEAEIQAFWTTQARPFLIDPIAFSISLGRWVFLLLLLLLLIFVLSVVAYIFSLRSRFGMKPFGQLSLPNISPEKGRLTSTDINNVIVDHRNGNLSEDKLLQLVINGSNGGVISKEGAAKALDDIGYSLIVKPDGKFAYIKGGENAVHIQ